jgi:hypothetical protein
MPSWPGIQHWFISAVLLMWWIGSGRQHGKQEVMERHSHLGSLCPAIPHHGTAASICGIPNHHRCGLLPATRLLGRLLWKIAFIVYWEWLGKTLTRPFFFLLYSTGMLTQRLTRTSRTSFTKTPSHSWIPDSKIARQRYLRKAILSSLKTLSGLRPICSFGSIVKDTTRYNCLYLSESAFRFWK